MYASVYVTTASPSEAQMIAKALIEKKLIACANLFPITSIYTWSGSLHEDSETAMIMKTRTNLVDTVISETKKLHSYEVPCIVSWEISKGYQEYLDWVQAETVDSP